MRAERAGRVAGVVLAAGMSSRLGPNKLLLWLDSEPLVRRAARLALEAGLSPVLVVLGHEAERVAAALDGLAVETVVNPAHRAGMQGSIHRGIGRVPDDCAAAVVLLADMPAVTVAMVEALVARFRSGTEPLVLSLYGAVQAPPTLYARSLFPALAGAGTGGGRQVVLEHRIEAAELRWPEAALADVDRPEDVDRLGVRLPPPDE
ncbi:MAG: nucleotidyltransferase family protein [Gemmatimonadales bacterium]